MAEETPDNLGADIAAAFDKLEGGDSGQENTGEGTTPPPDTAAGGTEGTTQKEEQPPSEKPIPPSGEQKQKPVLGRDGKPLKPVKQFKAPGSWKPEHREKFAGLDPLIQEEIVRRETEMDRGIKSYADSRKFQQEFDKAVQPFMPFIAAENSTPIQSMVNMFSAAAQLRVGSAESKANLIANVIQQFGVDIGLLDKVLTARMNGGQPQPGNPNIPTNGTQVPTAVVEELRRQFGPMIDYVNQLKQREAGIVQTTAQSLDDEISNFASDAKNEFFDDVREDMADILDLAANRNQKISLQQAYDRAIMLHPTISQIVAQRKLSGQAAQLNAAAERAENAAVSVRSDTPSRSEEPRSNGTLRDDILLAFDTVEKRAAARR